MKIKLLVLLLCMALVIGMLSGCTEEKEDKEQKEENTSPEAEFEYGPKLEENYTIGQDIWFNASGSSDADGDDLTYHWEFGDGEIATGVNVSYNYSKAGEYTVNLTVNDGTDDSKVESNTIYVYINMAPTASFKYNVTYYNETLEVSNVTFTDISTDPENNIVNWTWDLGDGTIKENVKVIEYRYNWSEINGDSIDVTLTVKDNYGKTDSVTGNVNLMATEEITVKK
jgi:PKD repeat protein